MLNNDEFKVKTSELTGVALDWAVASAKGYSKLALTLNGEIREFKKMHDAGYHNYSTDWAQGGPIIEREEIATSFYPMTDGVNSNNWGAWKGAHSFHGPTPLIAAMRCYVASKLGDTVEIPEELM